MKCAEKANCAQQPSIDDLPFVSMPSLVREKEVQLTRRFMGMLKRLCRLSPKDSEKDS
ncbi:hypothetical protein D3C77_565690 [compost metagenome]